VRVEDVLADPAAYHGRELPAEVRRVGDADVEALAADRRVHVELVRAPGTWFGQPA
jgi:hypothetical protein